MSTIRLTMLSLAICNFLLLQLMGLMCVRERMRLLLCESTLLLTERMLMRCLRCASVRSSISNLTLLLRRFQTFIGIEYRKCNDMARFINFIWLRSNKKYRSTLSSLLLMESLMIPLRILKN